MLGGREARDDGWQGLVSTTVSVSQHRIGCRALTRSIAVIRIYDRSLSSLTDPLKMAHSAAPKLVTTLKGKNRNWPIKATWYQGTDCESAFRSLLFSPSGLSKADEQPAVMDEVDRGLTRLSLTDVDTPPPAKRRPTAKGDASNNGGSTSRTRSRSASFSSSAHDHSDSDSDGGGGGGSSRRPRMKKDDSGDEDDGRDGGRMRPLERSLLLATGSSDNAVLLWDLSNVSEVVPAGAGGGEEGKETAGSAPTGGPKLLQRLEGHKESVYAVDFLQAAGGEEGYVGVGGNHEAYKGPGLLASAGGDWVVRIYKPQFREEE